MTKRDRVSAALRGEPVDRVPVAFWLHNFATENSAEGLAAETLRLARTFDWDFLKPQSRAQCFAEMWGLRYAPSREQAVQYTVTHVPLATEADLLALAPVDPRAGALGEQLEALRRIRAAVGPDTPIIWTVFAPLMVLPFLMPGGKDEALGFMRSAPRAVEHALGAMAETLAAYARACVEEGADGLFYATNVATQSLHVCGEGILFDEFSNYPVTAFSWAAVPGNPTLADGHRRTGRAAVGGFPAKPHIASATGEALAGRARQAIAEMKGRWLLLGPDCSINPETPEPLLHAAGAAAREARPV